MSATADLKPPPKSPGLSVPVADSAGRLTDAWSRYFVALDGWLAAQSKALKTDLP